jgi:hypothetical protein
MPTGSVVTTTHEQLSHTIHNIIQAKKFKNPKNKWSTNTQAKLFTMKYHRFSRRRKKSCILFTTTSNIEKNQII